MDGSDYLSKSVGARAWWRSSSGVFTAGRAGERVALALAGAILLTGCFSDPPADPEVQPLEIIAGNPDPDYGPCLLNVDEVGVGTHDVTPMSMSGEAKVRIIDPSGAVIFKRALESHAAEGEVTRCCQKRRGRCAWWQAITLFSASSRMAPTPRRCWSCPRDPDTRRGAPADAYGHRHDSAGTPLRAHQSARSRSASYRLATAEFGSAASSAATGDRRLARGRERRCGTHWRRAVRLGDP